MKLRSIFTLLIAGSLCVSAQTKTDKVVITDGPENDTKKSYVIGIFGYDASGYYSLRREKKILLVEHLSPGMAVDNSVEMEEVEYDEMDLDFHAAIQLNEKLYFLYTARDYDAEIVYLYARELNGKTLAPEGKYTKLGEQKFVSDKKFARQAAFEAFHPFSILVAKNKSHLYVSTHAQYNDDENEEEEMHIAVYTAYLQLDWERQAKSGFIADLFTITNVRLDDNGDVSIVGVEYKERLTEKQKRRSGKPNYTHHLLRYTENGTKFTSMPIELNGKFITDLRIETAQSGDVVVAGFYSEVGTFSIKGAFYLNIDPNTKTVKAEKFSEFGTEFITMNLTDREEKKAKKKEAKGEELEMNEFDMRDLILNSDGGATLIAEQYIFYITSTTYTDANGRSSTTYTYHYLYNDIIVISFNNTGELLWKTKIAKRQHTTNDGGMWSSFFMARIGDKLYFIFNDNPKNLFLQGEETPYRFSGSKDLAVVLVEVDNTGKTTREMLFTTERGDAMVQPSIAEQVSDKDVVICSQRTKIFQYSKLSFK